MTTKQDKDHMGRVAALGCIICGMPAEVHHIGRQGGQRGKALQDCIPLCPTHHRHGNTGVAVHSGRKSWEANFGTERELLAKCLSMLK